MSKQAVVKDGQVLIVDTDTGKYEKATPKPGGLAGAITSIGEGILGATFSPLTVPMNALTGKGGKK